MEIGDRIARACRYHSSATHPGSRVGGHRFDVRATMAFMAMDLAGYFERIGYRGAAEPALDVLQNLVAAHTRTIPFENLDPLLGVPVHDLSAQGLADKLVRRRRGGYCYEQNGLLGYVLAELGFRVRRFAGRVVWLRSPDEPIPAQTHTLLAVTFPGSRGTYLVDVGFGGLTPTSPIPLETGSVAQTPQGQYRLDDHDDRLALQAMVGGQWQRLYEFTTETLPLIDLELGSWYASTHPSSIFVTGLMAARVVDGERWNLHGQNMTIYRASETEKVVLQDAAAVVDVLNDRFGINIADAGERSLLETRIAEVFL